MQTTSNQEAHPDIAFTIAASPSVTIQALSISLPAVTFRGSTPPHPANCSDPLFTNLPGYLPGTAVPGETPDPAKDHVELIQE